MVRDAKTLKKVEPDKDEPKYLVKHSHHNRAVRRAFDRTNHTTRRREARNEQQQQKHPAQHGKRSKRHGKRKQQQQQQQRADAQQPAS